MAARLWETLGMDLTRPCRVSLVGGGGKTTLMYALVHSAQSAGRRVLCGTTTHIQAPDHLPVVDGEDAEAVLACLDRGQAVCLGRPDPETQGKLISPPMERWEAAADWGAALVAEADGAKRLPVKAPAAHEPVLLPESDYVLAVAGLSALGRPLAEVCFRSGLAAALLGVEEGAILSPEMLAFLLTSEQGQRKDVPAPSGYRIVLNQADLVNQGAVAAVAAHIHRLVPEIPVFAAALAQGRIEGV